MPGGRKKNIKKRQQEEERSKNLVRFLTNQGMSAETSARVGRVWPGGEPVKSPEKEMEARWRECCVCQARSNTKKCTGCFSAWFCGLDCQRKGWAQHKKECKVIRGQYSACHLTIIPFNLQTSHLTGQDTRIRTSGFTKRQCVVKIQLNCSPSWKPVSGADMMVYDRERSFSFFLQKEFNPEVYPRLERMITERGVWGLKGYFQAIRSPEEAGVESGKTVKVEINIENILPR